MASHRLLEPVPLRCGLVLPNRIALAPLTNTQSHSDGTLADDELRWLLARAEGGFGLVSTCAAFVSEEGHAWRGQLGIASDAHLPGLTRLAAALRDAGAPSVVQLHHGSVHAKLAPTRLDTAAAEGVRAATEADLERVVAEFTAAAVRAERAGFDGVEVHGANGYLFTRFLAPEDNPRTDRWGGSLENRARLLRDTVRSVRAAVSPGFALGVRINPVDTWNRRGLVLADGLTLAGWLADDGIDFLHLSLRDASGPAPFEEGTGSVSRAVREALPAEIPVLAAGGIWTVEDADRALDHGVDVIALGKAAIANPDWPRHFADPGWEPVRPPWSREQLTSASVGEAFQRYLEPFRGPLVDWTEA